ncbi:MAG: isoprenylcysteine carboxylmethyltransferase family protein [Rhizobium sp.]|nr:MAG: isoprenylcysteine carboxylmethyltransferase family protein [Rhizobium sp.]
MPAQSLNLVAASMCGVAFIAYIAGVFVFFNRPGSASPGWDTLKIIALAAMASTIVAVLLERDMSRAQCALSVTVNSLAVMLFLWSGRYGRGHLNLAFVDALSDRVLTEGPYSFVRHPIYVSYLLSYGAGAIAAPSPVTVGWMVFMGVVYFSAAIQEEEAMAASHLGAEYQAYSKNTGRFLPLTVLSRGRHRSK